MLSEPTPTGRRRDEGAALLMAIAFVTIIGLLVAGALSYAAVSTKATSKRYVPNRTRLYAADSAVKVAAAWAAKNPSAVKGVASGTATCVDKSYGTTTGNVADAVAIQFCPQGSIFTSSSSSTTDPFGLITLAKGSEDGIVLTTGSNGGLKVNGNVYAASAINVGKNAVLEVLGATGQAIQAVGGCTGEGSETVDGVAIDPTACKVTTMPNVDPDYQLPADFTLPTNAATQVDTSACTNKGTKIAVATPGTYTTDIDGLITSSCSFVWFKPGIYYIDAGSGSLTWNVKVPMIAGDTSDGKAPTDWTTTGAGCDSTKSGATFIVGGKADINLSSNGTFQVCGAKSGIVLGSTTTSVPRDVPLIGLKKDFYTSDKVDLAAAGTVTATTTWTNVANALLVDAKNATAAPSASKTVPYTSTLTIPGFTTSTSPVSTVTTVTATLTAAVTNADTSSFTLTLTDKNGKLCGSATTVTSGTATDFTCTAPLALPLSAKVKVDATSKAPDNKPATLGVSVDGVAISFQNPRLLVRSLCNGNGTAPTSGCQVISSQGSGNVFWLEGVAYVPYGKIQGQLPNTAVGLTTRGLVVRVLDLQTNASTAAPPIIASENASGIAAGTMQIKAVVGGKDWMTCEVRYTTSGSTVTGWSMLGCTQPR